MMRGVRVIKVVIPLIILLGALAVGATMGVRAQPPESVYFEATGHYVQGEFLRFYLSASDPLLIFGYPITDEITDSANNRLSQYFQRVRMDLVVTPLGRRVELAPLGEILHKAGTPLANVDTSNPTCRYFTNSKQETEHAVCFAFLQFYDQFNGATYFGSPVSDLEIEDNRYVQYFEHIRMEWRPELPSGRRVALSDLGKLYCDSRIGQCPSGSFGDGIIGKRRIIQVKAFAHEALISADRSQTVFIIAQDQDFDPVEGVLINATVIMPDGERRQMDSPMTDANGISRLNINPIGKSITEIVRIEIHAEYQGQVQDGTTWFRVWW